MILEYVMKQISKKYAKKMRKVTNGAHSGDLPTVIVIDEQRIKK